MPRVPSYEPQVQQQNLPNVASRAQAINTDDGSAAAARATGQIATKALDGIQSFLEAEKKKADELAVLEADNETEKHGNELLYGKNGALNRKGKDAIAAPDDVYSSWNTKVRDIESKLTNETQRTAYRQRAMSRQSDIDRQLMRHVSHESRLYDEEVTESALSNERNAAAASYLDEGRVAMAIQRQRDEITKHAARNGKSPEYIAAKTAEVVGKTHREVVERMLVNDRDIDAKRYFDKHKDELGGEVANVEKMVEEGSVRGSTQRMADYAIKTFKTEKEAVEWVRKNHAGKLEDEGVRRVKERFAERDELIENSSKQLALNASMQLQAKMDAGQKFKSARDGVDAVTWASLRPEHRAKLEKQLVPQTSNVEALIEFTHLSPGELASLSEADFFLKYYSEFDDNDRDKAREAWQTAITTGGTDPKLAGRGELLNRFEDALFRTEVVDALGAKMTKAQKRLAMQLFDVVETRLENKQTLEFGGKRKATGNEQNELITEVLLQYKKTGQVPNVMKKYEAPIGPVAATLIPLEQIPNKARLQIEEGLRKRGKAITREAIEKTYDELKNKR
jgi:hypothetical protein